MYVIKIKTDLNKNFYLNRYITKFSKLPFKGRFIKVQMKLRTIDGQVYLIGNQCYLDLKNLKTLTSYKLIIMDFYEKFDKIPQISPIKFIIFEYEELNSI